MSNRILVRPAPATQRKRRPWLRLAAAALLLAVLLVPFSGYLLVRDGGDAPRVWGLVLDGQLPTLHRSSAAAVRLASGTLDSVAVSGTPFALGDWSSAVALWAMAREGADLSRVVELRHYAQSTQAEARALIPFFRERGADTVALLTSSFHTARAERIFNSLSGGDPVFVAVDVGDRGFRPWGWWSARGMAKVWFEETAKTLWSGIELLFGDRDLDGASTTVVPGIESRLEMAGGVPVAPDSLRRRAAAEAAALSPEIPFEEMDALDGGPQPELSSSSEAAESSSTESSSALSSSAPSETAPVSSSRGDADAAKETR